MNTAREIVQEITRAGGELWFDGNRVRGRNIPRRLAVLVKADEGGVLAALLSTQALDDYAIEERLAIQEESAEVSTLPDKPALTLEEQAEAVLNRYRADWQRGVGLLSLKATRTPRKRTLQKPPPCRMCKQHSLWENTHGAESRLRQARYSLRWVHRPAES